MREFNKYLYNIFEKNGARHNSMTKSCYSLFKYENKLKIGREKYCTVLKCTQMRARVEKGSVLVWNKSNIKTVPTTLKLITNGSLLKKN